MLTVKDLVDRLGLPVLAGRGGLGKPVRWVHISELLDPTQWLSGGEVLLTTGLQLVSDECQREFVERLADYRLTALGIGTGFRHAEVPAPLLEAAAERDFPVFEVPYEVPFIAITEAAFAQLVNEQYAVLRRALGAHERLERIVLSEQGLDALAGAIGSLVGGEVLVLDGRGRPRVRQAVARRLSDEQLSAIQGEVHGHAQLRQPRAFVPAAGSEITGALALPVMAEGSPIDAASGRSPEAWLVAIKDGGALSDFDRLVLHQAVTIVALELLRSRVAGETERRLAGDVLRGLVNGELSGTELARRLEPLGLGPEVATIVAADGATRGGLDGPLAEALREEAVPALAASAGELACALVPGLREQELVALARRVGERLSANGGRPLRLGVGRATQAGLARRSFHEARCALEALALGAGDARNGLGIATYKDLGSFQLLLSLQDEEALRLFCDSILGPLASSEGRYGGELIRSLEAFIEENGQWERAARRLYCHRHTLRYRIRRIETLTGRSLQNARDRIDFWLALRGRDLIERGPST
jgi:PucR family transcriptional regulator, purine catabolism regulatory protein